MKFVLICDLVIALILAVSAVRGYRSGFVKTAFGCLTLVAAILLSYFFGSYAADFIRTTDIYDSTKEGIRSVISDKFEGIKDEGLKDIENSRNSFEDSDMAKNLERLGLDTSSLFERYERSIEESAGNAMGDFAEETSEKIAHCLANALGVLVVFILSLIALKLLSAVLNSVFTLPVLNVINKLAGLVTGMVLGMLVCFVLCTAVEILIPHIPRNPVIYAGMENDTYLYRFFLNLNPVILLLFG